MEKSFMDNSNIENERDDFPDHFNSTALHSDTSIVFLEPKQRIGGELKISPILSSSGHEKRSVFGRRIGLFKSRGLSPLAKEYKRTTAGNSISTAGTDASSSLITTPYDVSSDHREQAEDLSAVGTSSNLLCSPSTSMNVSRITNPFDSHLADSIHMSTLSPGLFEPMKSPENKDSIWSIEDRSILNPAVFTEEEIMMRRPSPDPHFEARIQEQLAVYWRSNAGYVPSPENVKPVMESPAVVPPSTRRITPFTSSPKARAPRVRTKALRNAASQTGWTFPPTADIDFERIFGSQFKFTGNDSLEEEFNVSLNSSSIARRLFDNSMVSSINESAINVEDDYDAADQSDVRHDLNGDQSPPILKDLDLSPIRN